MATVGTWHDPDLFPRQDPRPPRGPHTPLQHATAEAGMVTIGQAARQLGVHRELLYSKAKAGQVPTVMLTHNGGTHRRMRQTDVDALHLRMTTGQPI